MKVGKYEFPEGYSFDKYHGWVKKDGDVLVMGVTDMFQQMAGEIIFVEVPAVGRRIDEGQPFASIESGKWVGRLKAPVNGEIIDANIDLSDYPYLLNENPYDEGWVIKIRPDNIADIDEFMSDDNSDEISKFVEEEEIKNNIQ
ncbi:MAG: glycine cleavage system protein H [Clostridiales bacterium]|nr:MAG: glycine cleavage system protein H [Clostridiales bacterium]